VNAPKPAPAHEHGKRQAEIVDKDADLVDVLYEVLELVPRLLGLLGAHGDRGAGRIGGEKSRHAKRKVQQAAANLKTQRG
jgi:hypothetical protein